jgi:hypothetical protein
MLQQVLPLAKLLVLDCRLLVVPVVLLLKLPWLTRWLTLILLALSLPQVLVCSIYLFHLIIL